MSVIADIGWGRYRQYEGPFYRGEHRFVLPEDHQRHDRILAVTTATEGGRYDAINMYDGQVMSTTLIQLIERAYFKTSQFLGHLRRYGNFDEFWHFLQRQECTLQSEGSKFYFFDRGERVDTLEEQRDLFHFSSTGERRTWDNQSKEHACEWAAAVATLLGDPVNQKLQRTYLIPKMKDYCFGVARGIVDFALMEESNPWAEAFVSSYISFAVNSPVRATKHLKIAMGGEGPKFNKDWLIKVLKELTFGPKIAIYPHRYNAIRPVLEKLYDIDLPDFAKELDEWKADSDMLALSAVEVQKALLSLGYDLGPYGADGKWGKKTRTAMLSFEQQAGVPPEHCDGMIDVTTYSYLEEALYERGLQTLAGLQREEGSTG